MKRRLERPFSLHAALCLGSAVGCSIAQAQPPDDATPKAQNPPNWERRQGARGAARNRDGARLDTLRLTREQMVRNALTRGGFADPDLHTAVLEHMAAREVGRQKVLLAGRKLMQAFNTPRRGAEPALTDAQLDALLAEYRAALETDKAAREEAEKALDQKVRFSTQTRLEIALMILGAIGEGSALMNNSLPPGLARFGMPPVAGRGEVPLLNPLRNGEIPLVRVPGANAGDAFQPFADAAPAPPPPAEPLPRDF
jgi:hypothetical protein